MIKAYILVHTSADAFMIEDLFIKNKVKHKLVMTPREYSSDCGMSVYCEFSDLQAIEMLLKNEQIDGKIIQI